MSIQFGALEATKRFFQRQNAASGNGGLDGKKLTAAQLVGAGSIAGLANGIVSGPVEHIRIRTSKSLIFRQNYAEIRHGQDCRRSQTRIDCIMDLLTP